MVSPLLLVVFHLMHLAKLVSYGTGRFISSLSINLPSRLCISCSVPYGEKHGVSLPIIVQSVVRLESYGSR